MPLVAAALQTGTLLAVAVAVLGLLRSLDFAMGGTDTEFDPALLHRQAALSLGKTSREEFLTRTASHLESSMASPERINDPDGIKRVLQAGKTYRVRVKGGLVGCLRDRDYGVERRRNLAYVFEIVVRRTIERNDGHRIVELRHYERVRMAKLLSPARGMELELGPPGKSVLDGFEFPGPGDGIAVLPAGPLARAMLRNGARAVADCPSSQAFLETHPFSGRRVRLTYVEGAGVESIEPLGWAPTCEEARFLFTRPILSEYHLRPRPETGSDATCTVDSMQLADLLDPWTYDADSTRIVLERIAGRGRSGQRYAIVRVGPGVDGACLSGLCHGSEELHTPRGTLEYNLSRGFVERANLNYRLNVHALWDERLLYERDFQTEPVFVVDYQCQML